VHDRTVDRTSDGVGVVSALDLDTLRTLDFSSWHAEVAQRTAERSGDADVLGDSVYTSGVEPDRAEGGAVLTLERLLELVHDAARPVRLLVETKHPTRYGGLVEKELVTLLGRFGWAGRPGPRPGARPGPDPDSRVVVMSFAPTALRRVRLLAPDVPTVLLFDRRLPGVRKGVFPPGVSVAGPGLQLVKADPGFVERARARGYPVYVWTVNSAADVAFVCSLGVDTIITDRPHDVLAQLGETAAES
jgi:glycerophosphoryl diester phosphodiesterase